MKKFATNAQLRQAERASAEKQGDTVLMAAAAEALAEKVLSIGRKPVWFLCGPGNNGGDGLWAAAILKARLPDFPCFVLRLYPEKPYAGEAKAAWERVQAAEVPVCDAETPPATAPGLLVDALFGIGGGERPFDQPTLRLLERAAALQAKGCFVLACDVPSGLGERGQVQPGTLRADATLTFLSGKPGLLLYPGRYFCGSVETLELPGAEEGLFTGEALNLEDIPSLLPDRPEEGHKGTFGHVGILAGSRGMSGAGALSGLAALHSGCGKVTWLHGDFSVRLPYCLMECIYPGAYLKPDALPLIEEQLPGFQALAVGPGLSRREETAAALEQLLPRLRLPVVLDADGVWNMAQKPFPAGLRGVMTPHPGEIAHFLSLSLREVTENPLQTALRVAEDTGLTVLLKGAVTVIASPEGRFALLPLPNSGMATAGSGDVLTGIIAGLLARGMAPWDAARLGGLLHAAGGKWAAETCGASYMTAEEILLGLRADHCGIRW